MTDQWQVMERKMEVHGNDIACQESSYQWHGSPLETMADPEHVMEDCMEENILHGPPEHCRTDP